MWRVFFVALIDVVGEAMLGGMPHGQDEDHVAADREEYG
jgi:hypothetical protein